jgi:N-acetylmuramoyl-L-alanine amidase
MPSIERWMRPRPASSLAGFSRGARDFPVRTLGLVVGLILALPVMGLSQAPPAAAPIPAERPLLPAIPAAAPNSLSVQPAFSVVVDPAHGGGDIGARIGDALLEKNITLALAIRLRSVLAARGMKVATTRETDLDLPPGTRAGIANHERAGACLVVHATATGAGVHLFTSSLPAATVAASGLVPWQTAQAAWISRSLRLASEINSTLGQAGIPVTLGSASIQPLDNLACPAVAVEVAPLAASAINKPLGISDAKYQQRLLDALAAAMLEWSTDWKQQP